MGLSVGSLFTGIGGLDLGLEWAGMRVLWQCEIDPYCRAVLGKHWPGVRLYHDIHDVDGGAERVDLICGGFPCQPVSFAGKRRGQDDPRWLWPQFARVVGELRPRYVLVENVPGLASKGLPVVVADLAALGYDAEWDVVSAAAIGAPHLRERIFIVAYPNADSSGRGLLTEPDGEANPGVEVQTGLDADGLRDAVSGANGGGRRNAGGGEGPPGRKVFGADHGGCRPCGWPPEPDVGRVAHGVPDRTHRLRVLGNAVVPQVAEYVGRLIVQAEKQRLAV